MGSLGPGILWGNRAATSTQLKNLGFSAPRVTEETRDIVEKTVILGYYKF